MSSPCSTNAADSYKQHSASLGTPALLRPRALALRTWLDSWSGIGRLAVGLARQGYDLQLTKYVDHGWRTQLGANY
jgi:hypothetical protein